MGKRVIAFHGCFPESIINKTEFHIFQCCCRDRVYRIASHTPVPQDISFFCKTDDQFFLLPPFFMHFYRPGIQEIDTGHFPAFTKYLRSFFETQGRFFYFYQGLPFGQAGAAEKTI